MFGNLFEEDYSSVSNSQYGKGKKLKTKGLEPPAPREFTNLSGIRNQGGTCYLNSLLQTLHFTPEFREALFSIGPEELGSLEDKDKPDAKVRIIPLQLQRLFAQLLLLDQEAASTIDLTDSFGWTSDETFWTMRHVCSWQHRFTSERRMDIKDTLYGVYLLGKNSHLGKKLFFPGLLDQLDMQDPWEGDH